jgi:hypothetical protein
MPKNASRRRVAKFLLKRLNEANCEQYGISEVDISRLREVAYGARKKDRRSSEGVTAQPNPMEATIVAL